MKAREREGKGNEKGSRKGWNKMKGERRKGVEEIQ